MAVPFLRVGEAPTGILHHLLTLSPRQMRKVVAYFRYQVSTDVDLFRVLYKNIIDKSGWVIANSCWLISWWKRRQKNETVFRHIKDLRLSLGQISDLLQLRKESDCNVKLKWPDTGEHTVCAGESRALQTNWSNSLCNDVAGSRDLFSRYQCGFCRQGRKYPTQSAITFLTDSIRRDMDVRVRFFWKIQIQISESKSRFPNPETDFEFFWANPKRDHESIKSTLWVDSSDQIQIQIFKIHNLSVFLEKDLKKVFLTRGFSKK